VKGSFEIALLFFFIDLLVGRNVVAGRVVGIERGHIFISTGEQFMSSIKLSSSLSNLINNLPLLIMSHLLINRVELELCYLLVFIVILEGFIGLWYLEGI